MKRFTMALALMCALSTSIIAGEMPTGGKAETPPTTTTTATSTASTSSTVLVTVILTILSLR